MKAVIITETINKEVYEAFDGRRFKTKEECEIYENTEKRAKALKAFEALNPTYWDNTVGFGGGYDDVSCVYVETIDDIDALNEYLKAFGDFRVFVGYEFLGEVIFLLRDYDDYIVDWATGSELVARVTEAIKTASKFAKKVRQ